MSDEENESAFVLYGGLTREAQTARFAVPFMPAVYALSFVAVLVAIFNDWRLWLIAPFLIGGIAIMARNDDKIFRVIGLWSETKFKGRFVRFWGGVSYAPIDYRKKR